MMQFHLKMFKLFGLFLFLSIASIKCDSISFRDCGSTYYLFEVNIDGCDEVPCSLVIGGEHRISMGIYASTASEELRQEVYFVLRSVYRRVEVTPDNPCTQIVCPVRNNLDVSFSAIMSVNSSLVPLDGELYWRLINEEDETVVCMRTDIVLQTS